MNIKTNPKGALEWWFPMHTGQSPHSHTWRRTPSGAGHGLPPHPPPSRRCPPSASPNRVWSHREPQLRYVWPTVLSVYPVPGTLSFSTFQPPLDSAEMSPLPGDPLGLPYTPPWGPLHRIVFPSMVTAITLF